jgi:hypothetical protein
LRHGLDIGGFQRQRGVLADGRRNGVRLAQVPALEHFHGEPVNAVKLVAHRVVQGPAGLAIGQAGARQQVQLLAQARQAHGSS